MERLYKFYKSSISFVLMLSLVVPVFLPWQNMALLSAPEKKYALVTVLVPEGLLPDISASLERYAQDIQASLDDTKAMIVPVPATASSGDIYRVLEHLYTTGQKQNENTFLLSGIVLVGDVPLPSISDGVYSFDSIFPYTDFIHPAFFYDEYEKTWTELFENPDNRAEIWHGLIPGTLDELHAFFDKVHSLHSQINGGVLPAKDEMLLVASKDESKSLFLPLLGQYETKRDIAEELKSYRYSGNLASALYGSFLSSSVFQPLSPTESALFPSGQKTIFDTIPEIKQTLQNDVWTQTPDRYIKQTLDQILPNYAKVVSGHLTDLQKYISKTGRWNTASSDTIPEMITVMDEHVANQIHAMNEQAKNATKTVLSSLDSGVYTIPTGLQAYTETSGDGTYSTVYLPIDNYFNGKKVGEITIPEQCSFYRGSRFYENPYSNLSYSAWKTQKKQNVFGNDIASLFLADPLKNVPSQEVEHLTLYDTSSLIGNSNPLSQCDTLGGCCAVNFQNPALCVPDRAITPVFSWAGGKKITKTEEVRLATSLPLSESSSLMCQRFNFNEVTGHKGVFGIWSNPVRAQKSVLGPLNPKKIPSLVVHDNPSTTGEKSLLNTISNPLSKSLAVNRTPYIDLMTGDASNTQYVRQILPDFSRYQYKPNSNPLFTQYELSRVAYEHARQLVGGNSVANLSVQPKDTAGIATQSSALYFQRVLKFEKGKVLSSEVFPVPDEFGKTAIDYEIEILKAVQQKITELGGIANYRSALFGAMKSYNLLYRTKNNPDLAARISADVDAEVTAYLDTSWEWKTALALQANPNLIVETENKKGKPLSLDGYYLKDTLTGLAQTDASLNAYLPPVQAKNPRWQMIPLASGYPLDWLSETQKTTLPKSEGTLYAEVFEVMAVGGNTFAGNVPVGGRSFLGLRANAPSQTDFYAEVSGNTLRNNHGVYTKKFEENILSCGINADGMEEAPVPLPISESDFYKKNIVDKTSCSTSYFSEFHTPAGTAFPDPSSFFSSFFTGKTTEEVDFLFQWKDMTAGEKHAKMQEVLLNKHDKSLSVTPEKPYAYAHILSDGDSSPVWKGKDGNSKVLGIDFSKDPQKDAMDNYLKNKNTDPKQDEKCGPMEGVPLQEWIPAVQCWLAELQKTGIDFVKKCDLSFDEWDSLFGSDSLNPPETIRLSAKTHPLLPNVENIFTVEFLTKEGKPASAKDISFTVTMTGATPSSVVPDQDSSKEGLQLSTVSGKENIEIIPTAENVIITVTAQWNEWNKTESFSFSSALGAVLAFVPKSDKLQNGVILKTFALAATDNNTSFQSFGEDIWLSSSPENEVVFSKNPVKIGEDFTVAVRSDMPKDLIATVRGMQMAKYSLTPDPLFGKTLSNIVFASPPEYLDFFSTVDLPILALNEMGTPIAFDTEPTLTQPLDGGTVSLLKTASGYAVRIRTENKNIPLEFAITAGGKTVIFSLRVGAKNTLSEMKNWDLNALYATYVGIENYGNVFSEHPAKKLLHSSTSLAAVTTAFSSPEKLRPLVRVSKNGSVAVYSSSYTLALQSLSPMQLGVFENASKTYKGSFLFDGSGSSLSDIDIALSSLSTDFEVLSFPTHKRISYKKNPLFDVDNTGKTVLFDASFGLAIDAKKSAKHFTLALQNADQETVANISFATMQWVSQWKTEKMIETSPDYIFASSQKIRPFEHLQKDISKTTFGDGFEHPSSYALQFASGASVGESTKTSLDLFSVTLGDPTFSLTRSTSSSGFDQTIGQEIFSVEDGSIQKVFSGDINADGNDDLLAWTKDGRIAVLEGISHNQVRFVGDIATIPHSKNVFLSPSDDGFDDIVFLSSSGKWEKIENNTTRFTHSSPSVEFPQNIFVDGMLHDLDSDGNSDIVGLTDDGKLQVFYGPDFTNPMLVDSFPTPQKGQKFGKISFSLWNGNADSSADFLIKDSSGKTIRYLSQGLRSYAKTVVEPSDMRGLPDFMKDLKDEDKNGVPDVYENLTAGGVPEFVQEVLNNASLDTDGDSVPDSWDDNLTADDQNELENALDSIIDFFASCHGGSCMPMPINYAFFVPGQANGISAVLGATATQGTDPITDAISGITKNVSNEVQSIIDKTGIPVGMQPYVMTVFNYGPSGSFCKWSSCWQPCRSGMCPIPFEQGYALSTFRFYLSPTLTGGLGLAVCTGSPGITGKCFIQALPQDWLSKFCADKNPKSSEGKYVSNGDGEVLFQVESAYGAEDSDSLLSFGLERVDTTIPEPRNTRINSGGSFFARWANRQIEEFSAMLTMPALTIYYPDVTGSFYSPSSLASAKKDLKAHISGKPFENAWSRLTAPKSNTTTEKVEAIANTPANLINSLEYQAKSLNDFYRMIESVPLLQLTRNVLTVKVPSLSHTEITTKLYELSNWETAAKAEFEAFQQSAKNWPPEHKKKVEDQYYSIMKKVENLKSVLDFYKGEGPRMLADLDAQVAKYLYSLICYIDAITDLTGMWVMKNKIRYMKWLELFETLPEIMKAFQTLPNIFNGYQSYCETCRAGNYDSGNFVVNIVGKFLPEPPIIRFPRLPDITLDLSQINAAVVITVPEIVLKPIDIRFPDLPALALPRAPGMNLKINFPDIPDLPTFTVPELPAFPAIDLPKLPDLPPPPLLPSFMADFGGIAKVVEKGFYLYCLIIRQGIFIYPEMTTMSTVETLTARSLQPLSFDFLSKVFPDIQIPYVSEIKVTTEVNLEKNLDFLSKPLEALVKELNKKTTWFLKSTQFDTSGLQEFFDQSGAFDSAGTKLQEIIDSARDPINDASKKIEDGADDASKKIQEDLDDATQKLEEDLKTSVLPFLKDDIAALQKKWEHDELVDISELRQKMGLDPFEPPAVSSSSPYTALKKELSSLQSFYTERSHQHLAFSDNRFVSPPASSRVLAEYNIPDFTPANAVETLSKTLPKKYTTEGGIFLETPEKKVIRIMADTDISNSVHSLFFWNGHIVYATDSSVFIKKRNTLSKSSYSGSIETAQFSSFLKKLHAPVAFSLSSSFGQNISPEVIPEDISLVKGIWTIGKPSLFSSFAFDPKHSLYVLQARKVLYDQLSKTYTPKTNTPLSSNTTIEGLSLPAGSVFRLEPLDFNASFRVSDEFQFSQFSSFWIASNGDFGNATIPLVWKNGMDSKGSILFSAGDLKKTGYLYKTNTFEPDTVKDLSDFPLSYAWDKDQNGSYETVSNTFVSDVFRNPTRQTIPFEARSASGETKSEKASFHYIPPKLLDITLSLGSVAGSADPGYEGVPITLIRERNGVTKKISTLRETNEKGEYVFSDLNISEDVGIFDHSQSLVGQVLAISGILIPKKEGYSVGIAEGRDDMPLRQVLLNADKKVVANVVIHTAGNEKVRLTSDISKETASGVFVQDFHTTDETKVGILPDNAPENNGGAVIYADKTPLVMVYADGNIRYFSSDFGLRLKRVSDTAMILELSRHGMPISLVRVNALQKNLTIDYQHKDASFVALVKNAAQQIYANASWFFETAFAEELSEFSDVTSPLVKKALQVLQNAHLIAGFSDNSFRPHDPITRAQFVHDALALTHCLDCLAPSEAEKKRFYTPNSFPDVSPHYWADFCLSKAKKLGMIEGYGDGQFRPDQNITRAEAIAILLRESGIPLQTVLQKPVGDLNPESWYYSAMITALNLGVVDSTFGFSFPDVIISRGDFALLAERIFSLRDCRLADTDGDGILDAQEEYTGFDPHSALDAGLQGETPKMSRWDQVLTPLPLDALKNTSGNSGNNTSGDTSGNNSGNTNAGNAGNAGNNTVNNSNNTNNGGNSGNNTSGNSGNNTSGDTSGNNSGNTNAGNAGNNTVNNSNNTNNGGNSGNNTSGNSGNNTSGDTSGNNSGNTNAGNAGNNTVNNSNNTSGNNTSGNNNNGGTPSGTPSGNNSGNNNAGNNTPPASPTASVSPPLCTNVLEDLDGNDDLDGCPELYSKDKTGETSNPNTSNPSYPEYPSSPTSPWSFANGGKEVIIVFSGDPLLCGWIDFLADIRFGDLVWTALLSDDGKASFAESQKVMNK